MNNHAEIDGKGNIVIQGIDGSTITINPDNSDEIRKLILDFGDKLNELPFEILTLIENKQDLNSEIKMGANIYLTTIADLHINRDFRKLKFGLTITNLTKENRFFNQPFFKVKPKFEVGEGVEHDKFVMFNQQSIPFPKKLEYGEPISLTFEITQAAFDMYEKMQSKEDDAYIQAFVNTTVGELYESNIFTIKELFKNLKWLKQ